jgi:superfamily II DNA or RNA helicase
MTSVNDSAHRQQLGPAHSPTSTDSLYSAAQRIVQEGRVLDVRILQAGNVVTGIVGADAAEAHEPRKFRVYIRNTTAKMEGECSCGQRGICVHVAAVSIVAAGTAAVPSAGGTGGHFVQGTHPLPSADPSRGTSTQQQLCYLIEPATAAPSGDSRSYQTESRVSIWVAQRAAEVGSIVQGSACVFSPRSSRVSSRVEFPRYVNAQDREILATLDQQSSTGPWVLVGEHGAQVSLEIIRTGRAFLRTLAGKALLPGPSRRVAFLWKLLPSGEQLLDWEGSESVQVLADLDPPLYLDSAANEAGPVELLFDARVLREMARHPPIAPEQIAAINARMDAIAAGSGLPRLGEIEPVSKALDSLTAQLQLTADEQAILHFVYNGTPVDSRRLSGPPTDLVRLMSGGSLYEVPRDRERERLFESQLANALGMLPQTRKAWLAFMMEGVPALQAAGWEVVTDAGFPYRMVETQEWYGDVGTDLRRSSWFNLRLGVIVDGQPVNLLPALTRYLQASLADNQSSVAGNTGAAETDDAGCQVGDFWLVRLDDGRYLPIPMERIQRIGDTLVELFEQDSLTAEAALALPRTQSGRLAQLAIELNSPSLSCNDPSLAALLEELKSFSGIRALTAPASFRGELRHYQQEGLGWLQFLRKFRLGGILADDMGLGKTVQTLAHVALEFESGRLTRPVLIVAPVSALGNWQHELARFTPSLSVHTWHGAQRRKSIARLGSAQVVLTAYPLLLIDSEVLQAREFSLVILDEAQIIKNPEAKVSQMARALRAQQRLCLSGTPVENHLGELWSLFDFLQPGLLGSERHFQRHYRTPIEKNRDRARAQALSARLAPFLLRRTKDTVAKELPPKVEMIETITLDERQRDFYDGIRLAMHRRLQEVIREQGLARSQITILDALLKLRQVCCDPRLLNMEDARDIPSAKLEWVSTVLPELVAEGRRILLFSQFTSMLRLLETVVAGLGIPYCLLTGETQDRTVVVQRFQSGAVPLFLISLKAGGTALNLTAADTVIHYDPWWNPAAEAQATDRAHRIGQTQSVFVYKLITQDTVEERMLQLQADKRVLAGQLYTPTSAAPTALSAEDLEKLLAAP